MGSGRELKMKNVELKIIRFPSLRGVSYLFLDSQLDRRSNLMNMGKYKKIATSNSLWAVLTIKAPRKDNEFLIRKAL